MARSTKPGRLHVSFTPVTSTVNLAIRRWRQHWFLLLMTGLGIVAAVMIICTVPLFSEVMLTAALRSTLTTTPPGSEMTLEVDTAGLSSQGVTEVSRIATPILPRYLGNYLNGPPEREIRTPNFSFISPQPPDRSDQAVLDAFSMRETASHLTLVQGRLPQITSQEVEVAITPETAQALHVGVGSVITIQLAYLTQPAVLSITSGKLFQGGMLQPFQLHVVGLVEVKAGDPFWHGEDFKPIVPDLGPIYFPILASDQTLLNAFAQIAQHNAIDQVFFLKQSSIYWYYHFAPTHISINQLNSLINQLAATKTFISNNFSDPAMVGHPPYIQNVGLSGPVFSTPSTRSTLENFRGQLTLSRLPVSILALQIILLLLFFVSMMSQLLVDRQTEAIAVLRSWGASGGQVLGSLITQSIVLSLIALIVGPVLAIGAVYFIAQRLLPPATQNALNVISNAPVQALLDIRGYAIITGLVAIIAMIFFLYRASRMNVIATGRGRTLLQRLNLDVVAIIVALAGYGISLYLTNVQGLLDVQTQALISTPLALIGPLFLLLAAVLLFMRFFPFLLRLGSKIAISMRGAAPMLALAQTARAPRQTVRMTLLLALAMAFTIFTLVFVASQSQRGLDMAAYQAGADFSGDFRLNASILPLSQETALYMKIPGVTSATVGYMEDGTVVEGLSALTAPNLSIQIRAVDPSTFAQTMIWTSVDSSQPLSSLMAQLAAQRASAIRTTTVPAIVDAYTWNQLGLHVGASFTVNNNNALGDNLHYVAIAEVHHIPTVNDSSAGGVLVDYASLAAVQTQVNRTYISLNHVWLRTRSDPASLASVRNALGTGNLQLENLYDRRALADALHSDPLFLNLIGVLILGATAALLLAVVGNLVASWLSVRTRLTNFAVLRALGTAPRQIASVLLWEQGIVYATSLLLGIIFGVLLSVTVVPALVFTSITPGSVISNSDFYALQQILPVQLIAPLSLGIAFLALIAILVVALVMMMRVILRRSMSQVLRLSEDGRMDFLSREEVLVIARSKAAQTSRQARRSAVPSLLTLTLWRLRQVRFLLLLTCVGITAAVMIVCAVPLFSIVATTAGLRGSLSATPTTSEITLDTTTQGLSTGIFQNIQQNFAPIFQRDLRKYLSSSTTFTLQGSGFTIVSPKPMQGTYDLSLFGTSMKQAAPYITLLQGRLPQATNGEIEILLTPDTAQSLHVTVGSVITLRADYFTDPKDMFGGSHPVGMLKLQVVGLFNVAPASDSFWHGQDFQPINQYQQSSYTLLVPDTSFLTTLDSIASTYHSNVVFSPQTYDLTWRYYLDPSRVNINQLNDLSAQLNHLQADIGAKAGIAQNQYQSYGIVTYPYLVQVGLFNPVSGSYQLPATLDEYNNRVAVVNVPIDILSLQIIVLILFFVSLMANLLVERQSAAIAMLRSRGAKVGQIYGFLVMQSIGVGVIALVLGPILALVAIILISQRILPPAQQDAIALIAANPPQAILGVAWYAAAAVLVAILTMCLLLRRAATMDVLSLRRETARTTQVPFWQRFRLDIIAAVIALVGYGISLYVTSIGTLLDSRTRVLVATPLALIAPIFLLIGLILLFLRLFPYLLQWGARVTGRNRGAVSMLALAQVSRAPRQVVRMTMLLALATAFAIFTLVFTASQIQYSRDIATYETGADFSGDLHASVHALSLNEVMTKYSHVPGVISVTAGYEGEASSSGTSPSTTVDIRAVDSSTYARTSIWTSQDSTQSISTLMAKIAEGQKSAISSGTIPVIADANAMQRLNLKIGTTFALQVSNLDFSSLNFVVVAQVQHIPTINDNTVAGNFGNYAPPAGILVDYKTYSTVYNAKIVVANGLKSDAFLSLNHVWLRTKDDAGSLSQVRAALNTPGLHLENLNDRYALNNTLSNDPLYLDLIIILIIGAITALLLAVIGDLLTSWLNVRTRLTSFAVLRALGASPGQIASVLTWEQAIVYVAALVLGVVFGALLSLTVVPTLIFTGAPASLTDINEFYALQHIVPAQIVIPLSLDVVFIVLVIVCITALGMMTRVVLSPSMSQTLRLNED